MLLGQHDCRVDDKGRLAIPARLRGSFRDGVVLAQGLDRCIIAYPVTEWQKFSEQYAVSPIARTKSRRMSRFVFATAFDLELDSQGRVVLPTALRSYADIGEEVFVVGAGRYLEIWDKGLWGEEKALIDEQAWQLAEGMEER